GAPPLRRLGRAGGGDRCGAGHGRRLLRCRRRGAHLLHHDPPHPEQEQVEQRQEAELQDGEYGFGHYEASKRITVAPTEISSPSWRTRSRAAVPLTTGAFLEPRSGTAAPL